MITSALARRGATAAALLAIVLAMIVWIAPAALAEQSPAGCTSNDWDISIASPQISVVDGTPVDYTITVANTSPTACDIDEAVITLTFPDGTTMALTPGNACPAGQNADCYPANGAPVVFTATYISNEAVDAVAGVATAAVDGTAVLNRNPFADEAAAISKNLALTYVHPAIEIVKDTADPGPFPQFSDVTIEITVTNTGDVELENITVDDDTHDSCDRTFTGADLTALFGDPWLPVGSSLTYSCLVAAVAADVTDVATVTANPVGNTNAPVSDNDDAFIDVLIPAIEIQKDPDQTIVSGEDATMTITVTNTGELDLENVVVDDDTHDECDAAIGDLAIGESASYTCTIPAVTADVTDTALVTGNPVANPGQTVQDDDSAVITVTEPPPTPGIAIEKGPDQTVFAEDKVTITITVTNTGGVDLTNVVVDDDTHDECDKTIGDLAVGAQLAYTCTFLAPPVGLTIDTATVTGDAPGEQVTDDDQAQIQVLEILPKTGLTSGQFGWLGLTLLLLGLALLRLLPSTGSFDPFSSGRWELIARGRVERSNERR